MTAARKLKAAPTPTAAEKAIAAIDPAFIQCRDTGHTWQRFNARWIEADNCWEQILKCRQCSTERIRLLSRRGAILESHYSYVEGYTVHGIGRLTSEDRDGIRLRGVTEL